MSSTIHGASHDAIKLFRKNPAALAVYWIYCARVNQDNIAWPSLRGLAHDTGWAAETCRKARNWLVKHKALALRDDYVRPDWRGLPADERKNKQDFDRAKYYQPSGIIEVSGIIYPMLYDAAKDAQPEPEQISEVTPEKEQNKSPDVSPASASMYNRVHHAPASTELNTISKLSKDSAKAAETPPTADHDDDRPKHCVPTYAQAMDNAIMEVFGWSWSGDNAATKNEKGTVLGASKQLREVNFPVQLVPKLYARCKALYTHFKPTALPGVASEVRKVYQIMQPSKPHTPAPPITDDGEYLRQFAAGE